jgi:hypothetical protein
MAEVPVEKKVEPIEKKVEPTERMVPDVWRSFRGEMDRLFDRLAFLRYGACSIWSRHGGP